MSDFLVRLSANKTASALVRGLGLPLPQALRRVDGPLESEPLKGCAVFLALGSGAALGTSLIASIQRTGASLWLQGMTPPDEHTKTLDANTLPEDLRPHALVFDATGLAGPDGLTEMYRFFHDHVRGLGKNARAIVLARPPADASDPLVRAARRAVEGFVRSLGRELGRKGSTAQTVYVDLGAEDRVEGVLRFVLGKSSAYVSGQALHVSAVVPAGAVTNFVQSLAGKVALVTGAARGIGEATARALAREGATVIVMDRPAEIEAATAVANSIGGSALAADVTASDAAEKIRAHVTQHHGGLDILVHNAGITRDKMLVNMAEDRWMQVLDVNLLALIRTNEALLDFLRDGARIVCLSSIGGIAGNVGQTNYAATKAGVIGYIQGLAPKVAARGITVNAIAPGFIETKMTAAVPLATREVARRLCNLSQGGQPQDIAEAITFLASPGAAGMTGEVLRVCGGNFIGA